MFPTKASGLDGFPALFYQRFWEILGPNTVNNCLNILNNNGSIESWNKTNIVLIPKVKNPKSVGVSDLLASVMLDTRLSLKP